jgi:hypothetical protein
MLNCLLHITSMKDIFTLTGACLSGFFALFAGYRCSQAVGKIRRNDLYTYWGGGSFLSFLVAPLVAGFWGLAGCGSFIAMMWLFIPQERFQNLRITESSATTKTEVHAQERGSKKTEPTAEKNEHHQADRNESAPEASDSHKWSTEEIRQMEVEKQYSGNDPIVRARLGLPPKVDQ